ncbi:MAG: sarcosine oxidase subunit beta family protein, partial [Paracoccaceae bacterium]
MTQRYTAWSLFKQGLAGHRGWRPAWRKATPKPAYDAIVIGGGGHGLATAYYLAKNHGITRVALIERGWIGGGNTGRNTTVVRSNYFYPQSVALYDLALRLYEGLNDALNFNIMLSQRGMLIAAHTPAQVDVCTRIANAMQINGVDGAFLGPDAAAEKLPLVNMRPDARYRLMGGVWQGRGGVARHDAVAWAYARAASDLGVDIIETCAVEELLIEGGRITGVQTTAGTIRADRVGVAAAGATPGIVAQAGVRLPIQTYALQAFVSEPVKPCLDTVLLYLGTGTYVSQSDKGELVFGAGLDRVPTHGQRGNLPVQQSVTAGLLEEFPAFGQLKLLRQWGGHLDIAHDASPIMDETDVPGLFITAGWWGGYKAIPAGGLTLAH